VARVLFLTQVLPYPLDSGAKTRAYYVLRHLTQNHEVTLVSFVRADDRPEHVAHLEQLCHAVHTVRMRRSRPRDLRALLVAGLTGQSAIIVRDEIGEMHTRLRRLVRRGGFDVVHADQTSMAQYALYARAQIQDAEPRQPTKLLLDAHNALYRIPERMAAHERNPLKRMALRREARALARYEAQAYQDFDHVVFVADEDRQLLQERMSGEDLRFTTIPICVDPEEKPLVERAEGTRAVTHLGTMFWPPNVEGVLWFAREVFPQVVAEAPEARLVVIGKDPPQEVRDLPLQIRNVEVTGYVPDPAPYLAGTAVFIVPLRAAGGMRVKIVDAWCWGMPIVSTSIGAEGIAVRDGENILIADAPEAFAQTVVRVLQNPALGERLRKNGRRWVEERYNWRRVYAGWDDVYRRLLAPIHVHG
jgi:glycosyltransferase involved in cell wall biosynthesis